MKVNKRFFSARTLATYRRHNRQTFVVNLEVSRACNLRCPSCPISNMSIGCPSVFGTNPYLMPKALFEGIVKKLETEMPAERIAVSLENWGDPLLHPDLPIFIERLKCAGMFVSVSTNLNTAKNLMEIVKAGPDSLRVSLSGFFPETYGLTHRGGDIDTVKSNLYRLRDLAAQHGLQAITPHICYHWYRHNTGRDLQRTEELAGELGFAIVNKVARLYPLEKVLAFFDKGLAGADAELCALLLVTPEEWRVEVQRDAATERAECLMRKHEMTINYDGSVALCSITFSAENLISPCFLDTSFASLQERKFGHPTCWRCRRYGVHQSHGLDDHPRIQQLLSNRIQTDVSMVSTHRSGHKRSVPIQSCRGHTSGGPANHGGDRGA